MVRMSRLLPSLVAVALLAACAAPQNDGPESIAEKTGVELPSALQPGDGAEPDFAPGAAWSDDTRESFVVVVYGSSTCAPTATELATVDEKTLSLAFVYSQGPDAPCTADLAPNTYLLRTPDGVAASGEVSLEMTFLQGDETSDSTVPILD